MSIKISKKTKPIKVEEVEAEPVVEEVDEEEEISIQKPVKNTKEVIQEPVIFKEKKPRTQKQEEAFLKALEVKRANEEKRKANRAQQEKSAKEALQEIIVQRAIKIKQRQLKKAQVIEDLTESESEEDEPPLPPKIKQVQVKPKQVVSQPKATQQIQQQKYRFML